MSSADILGGLNRATGYLPTLALLLTAVAGIVLVVRCVREGRPSTGAFLLAAGTASTLLVALVFHVVDLAEPERGTYYLTATVLMFVELVAGGLTLAGFALLGPGRGVHG